MINGMHVILYSGHTEKVREFLGYVLRHASPLFAGSGAHASPSA